MLDGAAAEEIGNLKAIEAIRVLKARYFRFVDTKRWAEFAQLFAADGVFSSRGVEHRGRDAIAGWLSKLLVEGVVTVHQGHMPEIEVLGDKATGFWTMEDYVQFRSGKGHHGYGYYHDHYVREDGIWRIAHSELTRLHLRELQPHAADPGPRGGQSIPIDPNDPKD